MLLHCKIWMCTLVLQVVLLFQIAHPQSIVESLPGYDGPLPVKLETGYIGVGEKEEVQLFYYFFESERNPEKDPLLIWFCGGPACSVLGPIFYQNGPFAIDVKGSNSTFVQLRHSDYSWTKIANILYFDTPVGTGFSYSTTQKGFYSSDTKSVKDSYSAIRKWFVAHPKFLNNRLFIGGDSYAGQIVPPVTYEIVKGIEAGHKPKLPLQGYMVGNPITDQDEDVNWRITYVNRMGLISDEYYKQAEKSCGGQYVNPDPNNLACTLALNQIHESIKDINENHILEPYCNFPLNLLSINQSHVRHTDESYDDPYNGSSGNNGTGLLCARLDIYRLSHVWANLPEVRKALHIREGTIDKWFRCNRSIDDVYKREHQEVYRYHKLLTNQPIQALVYSGDHDLIIPHLATLDWVQRLNLTRDENWRSWTVDGQNAGFTIKYRLKNFYLVFATVKGGGHTPQEQRPKECFALVDRWLNYFSL